MAHAPEDQFLFLCLSGRLDDGAPVRAEALDWDYVLEAAERNRILPTLQEAVQRQSLAAGIPAAARERITVAYHLNGYRNTRIEEQLRTALLALRRDGVEAIVLKGAALAETVWGHAALRWMADIDVLVRAEFLETAERVVQGLGYTPVQENRPPEWYRQHHHHLATYVRGGACAALEIHRALCAPNCRIRVDMEGVWARAQAVTLAGVETRALSMEDTVAHLCLHVAADDPFVDKARSLADLARMMVRCSGRIPWEKVVQAAVRGGYAQYLYYPLITAERLFGAAMPPQVLRSLRNAFPRRLGGDCVLRSIARRCALGRSDSQCALPQWAARAICEGLLEGEGLGRVTVRVAGMGLRAEPRRGRGSSLTAASESAGGRSLRRLLKAGWRRGGILVSRSHGKAAAHHDV